MYLITTLLCYEPLNAVYCFEACVGIANCLDVEVHGLDELDAVFSE